MTEAPSELPEIDAELWAEFGKLSDRVHQLANWDEEDGPKPPPRRVTIEVPQEWLLLLAWMSRRQSQQRNGRKGATGYTPEIMESLSAESLARNVVRPYLNWFLKDQMHWELSRLCWGTHYLLHDPVEKPEQRPSGSGWERTGGDLDDDLPF